MSDDDRVMRHWRRCPQCRSDLRDNARNLTCETYLKLIGVVSAEATS